MAISGLKYWYDGQQRRFLEQIVRAFSGFQYQTGRRDGAEPQLKMVPCRMANRDRMVGHIMRNNSENTLIGCPLITVDQTSLLPRREALQNPSHVDTKSVHERARDPVTGEYTGEAGNRYTVRRLMPRPFEMGIQVDVWTSNLDQKHQLSEQIMTVFYPDITIQNGENALDWTARTVLSFEDISWSSRSIPIGSDDMIEVMTLTFKLPFWLSPPAEVTREKIIDQIVANINQGGVGRDISDLDHASRLAQVIVTPGDHHIAVDASLGTLTLLGPRAGHLDENGNVYSWKTLLEQYGTFRPALSEIRLKRDSDIESENEIVGTVQFDVNNPNILTWAVDMETLPANTLPPVNGIIDPLNVYPGKGLPAVSEGHRYLILNDIGSTIAWGSINAQQNDVIEYSGGAWTIAFDASSVDTVQHLINTHTGTQLRWTGDEWVLSVGGEYGPGYWRIHL